MSAFKERLRQDIHSVFLNLDEFADLHTINGAEMPAVIDSQENTEREKRFSDHIDGVYQAGTVLYVAATDYGVLPSQGSRVILDGCNYTVADAVDEYGVYMIVLVANRGRGALR